jgi:DNA helicase-2/ATP-dependent DNA helicase PcrA
MTQEEQNILSQLNDAQRQAVVYDDGPELVVAGAGSGKTRVLTYKIAWLLEHEQLKPWSVLALTFTNKAANEMKSRISQLVGEERARYLQMGTFHSVFSHILRAEAQHIGFQSGFTIYDETDSRSLIKISSNRWNLTIENTNLLMCIKPYLGQKTIYVQPSNMVMTAVV